MASKSCLRCNRTLDESPARGLDKTLSQSVRVLFFILYLETKVSEVGDFNVVAARYATTET